MTCTSPGPTPPAPDSTSTLRGLFVPGLLGSAVALAACSPPRPPDVPPTVSTNPTTTAEPDAAPEKAPAALQVGWLAPPSAQPVIDGELKEWGALPEGATVMVSLTKDGGHLVATLSGAAKEGVWILLSAPPDPLPELGSFSRDGSFYKFECSPDLEPAEAASCKATVERHAEFVAAREAEFERLFRLDEDGLRWIGKSGSLEAVPSSSGSFKVKDDRATAEVKLPLSALPRFSQAPVSDLYLAAVPGPANKPPKIKVEERLQVMEGAALQFEPYGELRELARSKVTRDGFSYHPGQPNLVEIISYPDRDYGGTHLDARENVLWEPVAKLGDVEIGNVQLGDRYLGITKAGKVMELADQEGDAMGHVERDGALHFFSWVMRPYNPLPAYWATWKLTVVNAAGATSEPLEMEVLTSGWKSVDQTHTDTFDAFSVRGEPYVYEGEDPAKPLEISVKYDKKAKKYVQSKKELKSLPGPKPAPAPKPSVAPKAPSASPSVAPKASPAPASKPKPFIKPKK